MLDLNFIDYRNCIFVGYIGGGRKFWDGSGGSGAALIHYEETGESSEYVYTAANHLISSQGSSTHCA